MMKIKRDQLINRLRSQSAPSISTPYITGDQSPNNVFNSFKQSVEWAIKSYVDNSIDIVLAELYTTEDLENDLGLNKPR